MTIPEALKTLAELLDSYDRCEQGDYFYGNDQEVCDAVIIAHGALSLYEREVPTPTKVNGWRIYCPVCGKQQKNGKAAPSWYCERCGQKLAKGR